MSIKYVLLLISYQRKKHKLRPGKNGRPSKVTGNTFETDAALLVATHVTFPSFLTLAAAIPVP